jgi:hypothetical protein
VCEQNQQITFQSIPGTGLELYVAIYLDTFMMSQGTDKFAYPAPACFNNTIRISGHPASNDIYISNPQSYDVVFDGANLFKSPEMKIYLGTPTDPRKYVSGPASLPACTRHLILPVFRWLCETKSASPGSVTFASFPIATGDAVMSMSVDDSVVTCPFYTIHYPQPPVIERVSGCTQAANGIAIVGCATHGGDIITIFGDWFAWFLTYRIA